MESVIRFVLGNLVAVLLVLSVVCALVSLRRKKKAPLFREDVVEALFSYYLLLSIGVSFAYNFVVHTILGDETAAFIGWAPSPFQTELGFASLGFAAIGVIAFHGNFRTRVAAVIGTACFTLGAAGVHVYQMTTQQNFAPGNAGSVFYMDFIVPFYGFTLLWLQAHPSKVRRPQVRRRGALVPV